MADNMRELLELAAKAVGLEGYEWSDEYRGLVKPTGFAPLGDNSTPPVYTWAPHLDDSDSRGLEGTLNMDIIRGNGHVTAICIHPVTFLVFGASEMLGDSPRAATRLAVLRAAAAKGRSMP